ncbi:uncharacterized protein LOC132630819 [Lycium barbarum]|uniref:uncharacterized protein LOC132630819 n=1 Tax=Lycium barbarum TaxID=112863 RepID=UPI00293F68F6|nr:uncharacterized protein LOC132630819 [Lycium barbarum]
MGSLAHLRAGKRELAHELLQLANLGVKVIDLGDAGVTIQTIATSSLVAKVKRLQYKDPSLTHYKDTAPQKKKSPFLVTGEGVLRTTYSAEDYVKLYIKEIVRLHGVPVSIISDSGTQFAANFCRSFQESLGTQVTEQLSYEEVPIAILDR